MKVQFRCKQSGNLVSFTNEQDIDWMRKEANYEEIENGETKITSQIASTQENGEGVAGNPDESNDEKDVSKDGNVGEKVAKVLKKRGRPRK